MLIIQGIGWKQCNQKKDFTCFLSRRAHFFSRRSHRLPTTLLPEQQRPARGFDKIRYMCGRYTIAKEQEALSGYFGAKFSETHRPIYNASPGQCLPVILDAEPGRIQSVLWGIPTAAQGRPRRMLFNARSETVDRLPTFREAFRQRRCLVLADGFYEWQSTEWGKQPYRILLRTDEPFAFAGIWQEHQGEPAYVILTRKANSVMRSIHNRMPVILERDKLAPWLDRDRPVRDVLELLTPYSESRMRAYPVSGAVNQSSNQDRGLIDPVALLPDRRGLLFD